MKIFNPKNLRNKDLIVFDLDGTLVQTKSPMDKQMSALVGRLLATKKVAVIGGGIYEVFKSLFLTSLKVPKQFLKNLYLFPATGTAFYRYDSSWKKVYAMDLTSDEKKQILRAFEAVLAEIKYVQPQKIYGKMLEDRQSEMTYSFIGQDVVKILGQKKGVALKDKWKRENTPLKMKVARLVGKHLPQFEVRAAGYTSIDVTKKGIDKAFGIKQMQKYLKVPIKKMLFVGDAIFPGGNDYAALKTGVDYVAIKDPEETKRLIRLIL